MGSLVVRHLPHRYFRDDWWSGVESAMGYRSLPADGDPLEAFAVVLDDDSEHSERVLAGSMLCLSEPFKRVEQWRTDQGYIVIGYYEPICRYDTQR